MLFYHRRTPAGECSNFWCPSRQFSQIFHLSTSLLSSSFSRYLTWFCAQMTRITESMRLQDTFGPSNEEEPEKHKNSFQTGNISEDDPRVVLGLDQDDATLTESDIRKAYMKLAMRHHPDKNGGSPERLSHDLPRRHSSAILRRA